MTISKKQIMFHQKMISDHSSVYQPRPRIVCGDCTTLSVQANSCMYCLPRNNDGPYTHVEVGYPSVKPEPWDKWCDYAEDSQNPTETIYAFVPVDLVLEYIESHGGFRGFEKND